MEERECKMSWFHNDEPLEASDKILISFDGTYATLFIAKCEMSHLGAYKVVFENEGGKDESTGKLTVKPVSWEFDEI